MKDSSFLCMEMGFNFIYSQKTYTYLLMTMLKHRLLIKLMFAFMTVVVLLSCEHRPSSLYEQLLSCEQKLDSDWIVVDKELSTLDTVTFNSEERALYSLLKIRLQYHKRKLPQNDSVLLPVIRYYKHHDDYLRLSQLYYLQGEIYRDGFFLLRAIESYNMAKKYAGDNRRLCFRLNIEMAKIYRFKMQYEEEQKYENEAFAIAEALNDSAMLAEVWHERMFFFVEHEQYEKAMEAMRKTLDLSEGSKSSPRSMYDKDMGELCLLLGKPDSALFYINKAIERNLDPNDIAYYKAMKGNVFMHLGETDSAEHYLSSNLYKLSLLERVYIYRSICQMKKNTQGWPPESAYLEKYVELRDSLDADRKEELVEKIQSIQEYKFQRERAQRAEQKRTADKILFYQLMALALGIILALLFFVYKSKQHKKVLMERLREEEMQKMEERVNKQKAEIELAHKQEKLKQHEIDKLNQSVAYYKQLNAITVPVLMKRQNAQGAMHLTDDEWNIIVKNTDACFDAFTVRLSERYPQLSTEEIHFCCLVKMELSMTLLSEIYHIAKGSISRKKMRLKEKMGIENMSFDEFISQF